MQGCLIYLIFAVAFTFIQISTAGPDGGKSFGKKSQNGGFDHRAHSVPGGPYSVLDTWNTGSALVKLSGSNSHTHFFNPTTGTVGRIVRYEWKAHGKVICTTANCQRRFRRGTHRVKLTVWDSTGDVARASTAVYVLAPTRPGVSFLYYPRRELFPQSKNSHEAPTYSTIERQINFFAQTDFPEFIRKNPFSVKVHTSIKFSVSGVYQLQAECGGADCNLLMEGRQVAISRHRTAGNRATTMPMFIRASSKLVDIVFVRRNSNWSPPRLILRWKSPWNTNWHLVPATAFTRNPSAYPPIIHYVTPTSGSVGGVLTLFGSSFVEVTRVKVGNSDCIAVDVKSESKIKCILPGGSGRVHVRVVTGMGKVSNFISFKFVPPKALRVPPGKLKLFMAGKNNLRQVGIAKKKRGSLTFGTVGYFQSIRFQHTVLKWPNKKAFKGKQLTAITIGPDLRYYIGSLNGFVHVLTVSRNMVVQDYCRSANIGYSRSILGLAFNPVDYPKIRLYASSNVLDWKVKKLMKPHNGWRNGEIVLFEPRNNQAACMVKTKTVITNLPVSNHDHGVNSLEFNSYGALLISVGGFTNAGISKPDDFLGGVPDSPLSGALLIAPVNQKGFNGNIKYNLPSQPAKTRKIAGNVYVYTSGLRNSMGHLEHSNGKIYATDNGGNIGYGERSVTCWGGSLPSVQEPDTFKICPKGGYLGYPNLNRGRNGDARQCRHHTPRSGKKGWTKPLSILESSTNGVIEYTANTFGAQMRGDVLATKFSIQGKGKTYRIQMGKNGGVKSLSTLAEFSGLTVAMSPTGGLVMPRVYQGTVAVLKPVENNPGVTVVTTVTPNRGPSWGKFQVTITGWNLYPPLQVHFGKKLCQNPRNFSKDGRSFVCTVPPGRGKVHVIVKRANGSQSGSYGWEFRYMKV